MLRGKRRKENGGGKSGRTRCLNDVRFQRPQRDQPDPLSVQEGQQRRRQQRRRRRRRQQVAVGPWPQGTRRLPKRGGESQQQVRKLVSWSYSTAHRATLRPPTSRPQPAAMSAVCRVVNMRRAVPSRVWWFAARLKGHPPAAAEAGAAAEEGDVVVAVGAVATRAMAAAASLSSLPEARATRRGGWTRPSPSFPWTAAFPRRASWRR